MGSRRKRKSVLPSWFAEDVKTIDQAKQGLTSNMELFVPLLVSYLKFVSFLIIPADVVFFCGLPTDDYQAGGPTGF